MKPTYNDNLSQDSYEVSDSMMLIGNPVVSVLMLAYNHGPYLAQAIESVLAQRIDMSIELLIGEDCSSDDTREIALKYQRDYPETLRIITADTNVGSTSNYQRILAAARGDFYAYLDGDDYWLPGKLARQVEYLGENPDCAAVYTNALTVDQSGHDIGIFNDVGNNCFDLGAMLRRGNFLSHSSLVYRATSRDALLEIDEPVIDYRLHLLLARSGFLAQISEPLTIYRIGSIGSMMTSGNDRVRQLYWEAIMSVPRELISDCDLARGTADFLRRVIFRALRVRQTGLLRKWTPIVFAASPYGAVRTGLLVTCSLIRVAYNELRGRTRKDAHGHPISVLYRR